MKVTVTPDNRQQTLWSVQIDGKRHPRYYWLSKGEARWAAAQIRRARYDGMLARRAA